jgi:hypothetical protein
MGYLTLVNFAFLINSSASKFFRGHRGLRQGSPLSPYLFLLVAEGVSQLVDDSKRKRLWCGIKIERDLAIKLSRAAGRSHERKAQHSERLIPGPKSMAEARNRSGPFN